LAEIPGNGSSFAQSTAYQPQIIDSYGTYLISLSTPDNLSLFLGKGSKALIEYPIHSSQIATAPEQINRWFFSNVNGFWRDENTNSSITNFTINQPSFLTKMGNVYVGELNFSVAYW